MPPDLFHTLQGSDLAFLQIIARAWKLDLHETEVKPALQALIRQLTDPALFKENLETLPEEARKALELLARNEGLQVWSTFTRRFGEVRPMGPARRDRERPDLNPVSVSEILWYRGLIGRAFLNPPPDTDEYAFIPDEFLAFLQPKRAPESHPGRPAFPSEHAVIMPAGDALLDGTCTLLAALRTQRKPDDLQNWMEPPALPLQLSLLSCAGILDKNGEINAALLKTFLEAPRPVALWQLVQAWLVSRSFDELHQTPSLICEGNWKSDPLAVRIWLLGVLDKLPAGAWWNLDAFIQSILAENPDFQRSGGDYDSWFIRDRETGAYLRGFQHWMAVEGAQIRFMITGVMHALGLVDLAAPEPGSPPAAFRFSKGASVLRASRAPEGKPDGEPVRVFADGRVHAPACAPRALRYQIARFCGWEKRERDAYHYRITPHHLSSAVKQGLKPGALMSILRANSTDPLPPNLVQAVERWEKLGLPAEIKPGTLLRVSQPEILEKLHASRAKRHILEILNPTTALIRPGSEEQIVAALAEAGFLAEVSLGSII